MAGMLTASIASGHLISRTGRYKIFPVIGTAVATVGLALLSRVSTTTTTLTTSIAMLVLGLGIGMVMQVLVIAVQNSVEYRDLGVATSGATLFRLVGGSLGTALLGAVFAARLTSSLAQSAGGAAGGIAPSGSGMSTRDLARLAPAARAAYTHAFAASLGTVFLIAAATAAVGFVLTLLLPEQPLRRTVAAAAADTGDEVANTFGRPESAESETELRRSLAVFADRDVQRAHIGRIVERAGLSLSPGAAWLLVQIEREPSLDLARVASRYRVPSDRVAATEAELKSSGLITVAGDGGSGPRKLTGAGRAALTRLIDARRAHLDELLADWPAEQRAAVLEELRRIVRGLVPDLPDQPINSRG
jgi:MFS family permease